MPRDNVGSWSSPAQSAYDSPGSLHDVTTGSKLLGDAVQTLSKAYVMASHEAKYAPKVDAIDVLNAKLDALGDDA